MRQKVSREDENVIDEGENLVREESDLVGEGRNLVSESLNLIDEVSGLVDEGFYLVDEVETLAYEVREVADEGENLVHEVKNLADEVQRPVGCFSAAGGARRWEASWPRQVISALQAAMDLRLTPGLRPVSAVAPAWTCPGLRYSQPFGPQDLRPSHCSRNSVARPSSYLFSASQRLCGLDPVFPPFGSASAFSTLPSPLCLRASVFSNPPFPRLQPRARE